MPSSVRRLLIYDSSIIFFYSIFFHHISLFTSHLWEHIRPKHSPACSSSASIRSGSTLLNSSIQGGTLSPNRVSSASIRSGFTCLNPLIHYPRLEKLGEKLCFHPRKKNNFNLILVLFHFNLNYYSFILNFLNLYVLIHNRHCPVFIFYFFTLFFTANCCNKGFFKVFLGLKGS
jgi:hypothetical protein